MEKEMLKNSGESLLTPLKWVSFGDTITSQELWQGAVATHQTLDHTNLGIAGTQMAGDAEDAMWQDSRISDIPSDTQVFTVLAGTSDWQNNVAIGDIDSEDTNTFIGAYNVCLRKVIERLPLAKIFIMGVPFAYSSDDKANTTKDYAEAARLVARKWNLRFIDTAALGWNSENGENYLDANKMYPNEEGAERMAQEIINGFNFRLRLA